MMKNRLVIKNDILILNHLDLVLREHGYTVVTVQNCKRAIVAFAEDPFDLVLTDISMPGQDGNPTISVTLTGDEKKTSNLFDQVVGKPVTTRY